MLDGNKLANVISLWSEHALSKLGEENNAYFTGTANTSVPMSEKDRMTNSLLYLSFVTISSYN